jgi:hypothetical protein
MQLVNKAFEKRKREQIWQRWLVDMPRMKEFISFEDYYKKFLPVEMSQRSKDEILSEAEEIRRMAGRG